MKNHVWRITLAAMLCSAFYAQAQALDPKPSKLTREEAQQLLKDLDDARPRAETAEQKSRDAGVRPEALGFEKAKALRDEQAVMAYDRYLRTTKEMEALIKEQVVAGKQAPMAADIARFERLQAEVDLARVKGWLPAQQETETTLALQRARAALRAEQMRYEDGNSTLYNVIQAAKELRTVETQPGAESKQRIYAHVRYLSLVAELKTQTDKRIESGLITPLDGKLAAQELKQAQTELQSAVRNQ